MRADVKKSDVKTHRKPGPKMDQKMPTDARVKDVLARLTVEWLLGHFASRRDLGAYLLEHFGNQDDEYGTLPTRFIDPHDYVEGQIENGSIVVVSDRHGLWAFTAQPEATET